MAAEWYSQLVAERRRREVDFSADLGAGETISSVEISVTTVEGDGTAAVTGAAVSDGSMAAEFILSADLPGLYLVTTKAPTSSGQTLLAKTSIRVSDGDGVVPGGYASAADLQAAFGSGEIERLGDAAGARVDAALVAATAEIDAHLGRYRSPLGDGPWPLLAEIAAALARGRLYDDEVPAAVAACVARARKMLKGLADGSLILRDAAGAAAPTVNSGLQVSGGEPVMTRQSLEGF